MGLKRVVGLRCCGIFLDGVERERDNGALCEGLGLTFGLPLLVERDDDLALQEAVDVGLAWERDADGSGGREEQGLGVEEVYGADEDGCGVTLRIVQNSHGDEDVGVLCAVDLFCGVERLSAPELFDDEGIAGFGHGAGTPVACDEEVILVEPGDVLFGFGQGEAVGDEGSGAEVELAEGDGVFAASGEAGEAE